MGWRTDRIKDWNGKDVIIENDEVNGKEIKNKMKKNKAEDYEPFNVGLTQEKKQR